MLKLEERVKLVRSLRSRNKVDILPDPVADLEIQKGGFRYACSPWSTKFGWSKLTCDTRVVHFAGAALAWMKKKRSLRNEKLKATRASET